jgi:hypothetical protein
VKKLRMMSMKKDQLERLVDDQIVKAPLEQFSNQPEDTLEEEEDIDENTYAEFVKKFVRPTSAMRLHFWD